ncbi:hypothetical protein Q1695_004224 [Nippostrongylus brasiliensis]|nr:hypothetical protein Q1695_004224 [Nippostrongylus brasiliensis]
MLSVLVSAVVLVVPCVSQSGHMGPVLSISPPKQCQKSNEDYAVRSALFYYLNNLRRDIGKGLEVFPNANYSRGPRLMYLMKYDCGLELEAKAELSKERVLPLNVLKYGGVEPSGQLVIGLTKTVAKWKRNRSAHSLLMNPYVPFFGCAHEYKNQLLKLICIFKKIDFGAPSTRPAPCKRDSDCNWFIDSKCEEEMCVGPDTPYNLH